MYEVSKKEMIEIDKLMVDLGVNVTMMMEHAGFQVAKMVTEQKILVLCGHGNNGGDGLCAARHLINWGREVDILLVDDKKKFSGSPLEQLEILEKMGASFKAGNFEEYDLIIDALLGYNIKGNPRGKFAELIKKANSVDVKKLSIDLPSGYDMETGGVFTPCIKADATLSLTLPKKGLGESEFTGDLFVAYMSVPFSIFEKMELEVERKFVSGEIIGPL